MPQEKLYVPGETLGAFKIVRLLATGGMGTVYEATPDPILRDDLIAMDIRRVAIKVPRVDALARTAEERRQLVERFEREYKTLLTLMQPGHSNLVEVYEFGWQDDVPFLVMEHVEGPTLEEFLAGQPPLQKVLEVFRKLCEAVAFLHSKGVCHRDIKPANVLLRDGEPVLVDLGSCLPPTGHRLTAPGELVGTPLYLSPQACRDWLDSTSDRPYLATSADDVWALGVCFYEGLTGDVPWQTPPRQCESLLKEIQDATPPHPSALNPQVPRALGDIALRLLERDVGNRPRDGAAVLALLGPALRGAPVVGSVPVRARPARALSRRVDRRPATWVRSGRPRPLARKLALMALVAMFGLGVAGREVLEALRRVSGSLTFTGGTPAPRQSKPQAEQSQPIGPLPGQLRPPCHKPNVEDGGACWIEIHPVTPEGEPAPCPIGSQVREVKGKDGRLRCYSAVMAPTTPNTEVPVEGR